MGFKMNFIEKCLAGKVTTDQIDDYIDFWHNGVEGENQELHEYLGMSWDEYSEYVMNYDCLLTIIQQRKNERQKQN
jgi:hypothetical protein